MDKMKIWEEKEEWLKASLPFVSIRCSQDLQLEILHNSTALKNLTPGKRYPVNEIIDDAALHAFNEYLQQASTLRKPASFLLHESIGKKVLIKCFTQETANGLEIIFTTNGSVNSEQMDLLAIAAHDVRSPINSIIGLTNVIEMMHKSGDMETGELMKMVQMIKTSAIEALGFTNDVLEVANVESETCELEKEVVSMGEFIAHYINTHRLQAIKKSIDVSFKPSVSDGDKLAIDKSKFTRVFDNLMSNAIKFSPNGSKIEICLSKAEKALTIEIRDNGVGMSEDMLKSIFVKFGKAKRVGLAGEKSHGLGMSIVKQIIELHGGTVSVSSTEGKGTAVKLVFLTH